MANIVLLTLFCICAVINGFPSRAGDMGTVDVSVSRGQGELEMWVRFSDITASETVIGSNQRDGVILRRVTDGRHLVQSLTDWDHRVHDCTVTTTTRDVSKFLADASKRFAGSKSTVLPLSTPANFSIDPRSEVNSTSYLIKILAASSTDEQSPSEDFSRLKKLLDISVALTDCSEHLEKLDELRSMQHEPVNRQGRLDRDQSITDEAPDRPRRAKRSAFIIPGTLWCGPGTDAESYDHLGKDASTDACCREHDHCPKCIESWGSKFGIFNYRLYAISDCDCDKRFSQCLRDVGTNKAKVVGDWFFNILQLSCFEVNYKPTCLKYDGWFGSVCKHFGLVPYAKISTTGPIEMDDTAENATMTSTPVPLQDDYGKDSSSEAKESKASDR